MARNNSVINPHEGTSLLGANPAIAKERKRRFRITLALLLSTGFFVLVAFVAVWFAHIKAERQRAGNRDEIATSAKQKLNVNLRSQSKQIKKGCESTLIVVRHCEKLGPHTTDRDGNEHCSYIGFERAKFFATLFGNSPAAGTGVPAPAGERWPTPLHLFALSPDRDEHWNFREWETLYPLSRKLEIDIDIVNKNKFASMYFDLLGSGSLCGRAAVISWKHELIPGLAAQLGCGTEDGCPGSYPEDSFDQVWQIKFVFHPFDDSGKTHEDEQSKFTNNNDNSTVAISPAYDGSGPDRSTDDDDIFSDDDDDDDDQQARVHLPQSKAEVATDETQAEANLTDTNSNNNKHVRRRRLKHHHHSTAAAAAAKKKKKKKKKKDRSSDEPLLGWSVYGAVTQQYFDPLAFSKLMGDYPEGGTKRGGRWAEDEEAVTADGGGGGSDNGQQQQQQHDEI